jgi:hypothetical protein
MATHDEVHEQIFNRINVVESKIDTTNGYLKGVIESNEKIVAVNEKLIALIEKRDRTQARAIWGLITLLLFALAIIGYGAIGDKGMHSVRQTVPSLPHTTDALPAHDDFDKWQHRNKV